jgi:hypothetical protein
MDTIARLIIALRNAWKRFVKRYIVDDYPYNDNM